MQDYLSELPQEIVDWDPRLISINTNGFTNSHRYILTRPSDGYYIRGYLKIWPIVRACVYYQIWLQRADRTFRVDLPFKSPLEISLQAAGLIKLHLRQLLQDLPLKKGYIKVFNLLKQLSRDSWLKQFVLPDAVQD
ncbi:Aste57867_19521 [Aphanomyces stellatus]|uniref:Aste57867_19521 protein n=2 Tax=Aphanomyces stellatus TaxID=120398 RepID=A0A485LEN9_9STRA|nr:hypothetical protein As57867_019457 [Aphanomyces stellatus]VFT96228.1 Aste57867_19521 [Aphanomyces stellatus]